MTDEHYLPLLYAAAMRDAADKAGFTHEGIEVGSMSMRRAIRLGPDPDVAT